MTPSFLRFGGRHVRKHGPGGYKRYQAFKDWLRDEFMFRCVYCLVREQWFPDRQRTFPVEHAIAKEGRKDLECDYENLLYSCAQCNDFKGTKSVLNPARHSLNTHLRFEEDGTITPLTRIGQEHCVRLELNRKEKPNRVEFRERLIKAINKFQARHPQFEEQVKHLLGYPTELPDLRRMRPPHNSRPLGLATSAFMLRSMGKLPETY